MAKPKRKASIHQDGSRLVCSGVYTVDELDGVADAMSRMRWSRGESLVIDASEITQIDTVGAWLLHRTIAEFDEAGHKVVIEDLDEKGRHLIQLVSGTGIRPGKQAEPKTQNLLENVGAETRELLGQYVDFLAFVGRITVITVRIALTPMTLRWGVMLKEMKRCGFDALPIVGLLMFLIGVVFAYQGGVVLQRYGGSIFIADMVGFSVLRELAPLITAIIVAGRTGSSYAAEIGTMKVTEEVDALRTMGILPIDMLVIPKLVALFIALPLLTVYADILGLFGGLVMAYWQLGVTPATFIQRLTEVIDMGDYLTGLGKAPLFAGIIASVGCYRGFQVGFSADSVGRETTIAVVQSIFLVIVTDAVFSVIFSWLEI